MKSKSKTITKNIIENIQDYIPNHPHPGEIILHDFLLPSGISQREFATKIKWSPRKVNEIINGKRGITALSSIELSKVLGPSADFWMNLQKGWELSEAHKKLNKNHLNSLKNIVLIAS
jgi:addiction module HigA family antidote